MPFSFQPQATADSSVSVMPQAASPIASFGTKADNLMARAESAGTSMLDILFFGVFGLSIAITLGLFGYKYYLSSQVDAKKAKLDGYEAQLAGFPINDMKKLSNRLKVINKLVKSHPSVQVAFLIIESSIENAVTYNKFSLRYDESTQMYQLTLGGTAPDYKTLEQQLEAFSMKPYSNYMTKVTLGQVGPDADGSISFTVSSPITIQGYIPETFSVLDGVTSSSTVPGAIASSTPATSGGTGSSTPVSGM